MSDSTKVSKPPKKKLDNIFKTITALAALLVIMWGYVLMGATMFLTIEGKLFGGAGKRTEAQIIRIDTVEKMVTLHNTDFTTSNTTFKTEVEKVLKEYKKRIRSTKDIHDERKWTYDASLLYTASLVTTVGYGNIVPMSSPGRLMTIIYSVIGIPLTLVCLGMLGTIMARGFKALAVFLFEDVVTEEGEAYIPLKVSLGVMFGYLFLGAILFRTVEPSWTFLESFYFCFVTLSTIGLGDFVYGEGSTRDKHFVASVMYLLFGLALLSMCFNLMQDQASYQLYQFTTMVLRKLRKLMAKFEKKPNGEPVPKQAGEKREKRV